jgi:hypothetical protein
MRMMSLFIPALFLHLVVSASTTLPHRDPMANQVNVPLPGTNRYLTLEDFLKLTPQSYKGLTGRKMSLVQRVDLTLSKHWMKKMIHKDGSVDLRKLEKRALFGNWQWHWGGFVLGLFLSFLGPIVALFFNDDYKWDRFWRNVFGGG